MSVCGEEEYDDPVDLEMLIEKEIVHTDIKQLALLTLYADYQVQEADNRAQDIYLYFSMYLFQKIHIEEMFRVGRENLTGTEQFWKDWIALLKTKCGEAEGRLLQEYDKKHDYLQIERTGERALEKIDSRLIIRSRTALKVSI